MNHIGFPDEHPSFRDRFGWKPDPTLGQYVEAMLATMQPGQTMLSHIWPNDDTIAHDTTIVVSTGPTEQPPACACEPSKVTFHDHGQHRVITLLVHSHIGNLLAADAPDTLVEPPVIVDVPITRPEDGDDG